jgi:pimeloyl-ACP methyl ester carboxylesterase
VRPPRDYAEIILAHGSGPDDRDGQRAFLTLRQHFATHGYAVLCYDKPGVGHSTGDWTRQSFDDRACEVLAALQFLQTDPAIDGHSIGVCGGSQAGWIMPMVAQLTPDLAFIIWISGPAVMMHEQEAYRIERQLRADHFTEQAIRSALAIYHRRLEMIRQGATIAQSKHVHWALRIRKRSFWLQGAALQPI